jgi:hypothetical protein
MRSKRWIGPLWLLLSSGVFVLWGVILQHNSQGEMPDLKAVYYGARCLIRHTDPYQESEFLRVYLAEGGKIPTDHRIAEMFSRAVPVCINLPTTLLIVAPLALMAWGPAHVLWIVLVAGSLIIAAFLVWDLARGHSPAVSLLLICMVLANSEVLIELGNTAGISVGLCIIAVWCFFKERFVPAGIVCLAVSLAIKPHDAGLVWLYFVLAGGAFRRRGLQALAVTAALCLPAVLWVSSAAPYWMQELHSNLATASVHGGLNDPGPASIGSSGADMIVDLQSSVSVLRDDPRFYNPTSYMVCGALLIVWAAVTLKARWSPQRAWFALAAIAALSMLPVYHRQHDAKLLLLTVPACAMLWAAGGTVRWIALTLNLAAVVLTGDIPTAILYIFTGGPHAVQSGILEKSMTIVLMRPSSVVLLFLSVFYLVVYARHCREQLAWPRCGWLFATPLSEPVGLHIVRSLNSREFKSRTSDGRVDFPN